MRCRPTILAVVCAFLTLALGLVFVGDHAPSGIDDGARSAVTGWPHGMLRALVLPTEPYVLLPVLALLVVWCLHASRPWDALFVVLGPAIAVASNIWLLKPLFDRWKGDTLVYPSGHTVSMVATLAVLFVLTHGLARAITAVAGAVLLIGVTIGMVGLGYHYLTDIIGGTLFAMSVVPATINIRTCIRILFPGRENFGAVSSDSPAAGQRSFVLDYASRPRCSRYGGRDSGRRREVPHPGAAEGD